MLKEYVALIECDDKVGSYGVVFPDFPGCITVGNDFQDAVRMAHEALSGHVKLMQEDGEKIPKPRSLQEVIKTWKEWKEWEKDGNFVVTMIALLPARSRPVRLNILMDESLVNRLDKVTRNRSAFISEAIKRALKGF